MIWIYLALAFMLGLFIREYLPKYVSQKAENRAMKEDIATLTRLAEEIKSAIADRSWDRQRQWEMKRDAVLAMVESLGLTSDAVMSMVRMRQIGSEGVSPELWTKNNLEMLKDCNAKIANFNQKQFGLSLLCSGELRSSMMNVHGAILSHAQSAKDGVSRETVNAEQTQLILKIRELQALARHELGL